MNNYRYIHQPLLLPGRNRIRITPPIWFFISIIACFFLLTSNPLLSVVAIMVLPLCALLVWRTGEPPILFFGVSLQWLQISMKVFQSDLLGITVAANFGSDTIATAIWLSLAGLVLLCLGINWGIKRFVRPTLTNVARDIERLSIKRLSYAYVVFLLLSMLLPDFLFSVQQIRQFILSFLKMKEGIIYLIALAIIVKKKNPFYLFIVVLVEVIVGITGYFSGFKTIFFILIVAMLTISSRVNLKTLINLGALIAPLLVLALAWTEIKTEYRTFLNLGTGQQIVGVSFEDRLDKAVNLMLNIESEQLPYAAFQLSERVSYIGMFADVLRYVPASVPHEHGTLVWNAIKHVLLPRLFYPDKPMLLPDSQLTMQYTGLHLASSEEGTCISMGYMPELYIDFGSWLMFLPILLLGYLFGFIYSYILSHSKPAIFGFMCIIPVLVGVYQYEISLIKLLGGTLMSFIVVLVFLKYLSQPLNQWLTESRKR